MDVADHLAAIRRDGELLAVAAAVAGPDARIPTCPDWCTRDLVRHQGEVHRWATAIVRDAVAGELDSEGVVGPWPDDDRLVPWFREGCAALVDTLASASPDLDCFTFLSAPSALAFWARRQAHETAIHRVDAERALGPVTRFPSAHAVDGVEEILFGFASRRRSRLRSPAPRTLQLRAHDAGAAWHVAVDADRVAVTRGDATADCTVTGSASDLYLFLWNRAETGAVEVGGDAGVVDLWRETMQIRWS